MKNEFLDVAALIGIALACVIGLFDDLCDAAFARKAAEKKHNFNPKHGEV